MRRGPRRELGDDVGERIEVFGAAPSRRNRLRGTHFGIHAEHPPNLGDQVGQGVVQLRAQRGQLPAQRDDPGRSPTGEYRSGCPGSQIASARQALSASGPADATMCVVDDRSGDRSRVEFHRPPPQRGHVGGAQPPARPGEDAHRRRPGGGVGRQPQHRDDVGHLGHRQQARQSDHLDRHPAGGERVGDRRGIGVAPHQHRRRRERPRPPSTAPW